MNDLGHVRDGAAAAGGDDRDAHGVGDGARQREVEAVLRAVAVHAREQDLARAPRATPSRAQSTASMPGRRAPAVDVDLPAAAGAAARASMASDDALRRRTAAPARSTSSGSRTAAVLTATLSAPARSRLVGVVDGADAAADGERHEDRVRHPPHHVDDDRPRVRGGGDVEEDELVGPLGVVARGALDGVAGVAQVRRSGRP